MSSSTEPFRPLPGTVVRGTAAGALPAARLDLDLRGGRASVADTWQVAHDEGYAVGWSAGYRAASERVAAEAEERRRADEAARAAERAQVAQAVAALCRALDAVERAGAPTVEAAADTIAATAYALAETIVGRELASATEPGLDAVRRALADVPAGRPVTVRLSPADAATIRALDMELDTPRDVTLLPDPALSAGDGVAVCDATTYDARIAPALARVKELLAP